MTSENLLQLIRKREIELAKHPLKIPLPLEEVMTRSVNALDLGRGDLRRYGCFLESTVREIEGSILMVAGERYFAEARDLNKVYVALEEQSTAVSTQG